MPPSSPSYGSVKGSWATAGCNQARITFMICSVVSYGTRLSPDPALIDAAKAVLEQAPGWARVGLTFGNDTIREAVLAELATGVVALVEPDATM